MATFGFTRASEEDVFRIEGPKQSSSPPVSTISGLQARQFYEDLVKDGGDSTRIDKNSRKRPRIRKKTSRSEVRQVNPGGSEAGRGSSTVNERREGETTSSESSRELQGLRLLRCAHEGDTAALRDLLSKGADINFQDSFFWTALMCASWSGHTAAVRLLLERGAAWVGVVDLQGRDARDLALEAGHTEVVDVFDGFGRSQQKKAKAAKSAPSGQQCDVCGSSYSGPSFSHLSSTLHQFSLHRPPPTPHYCLPPSSTSYRMMLRSGWTPGSGLGPEGTGPHQPVPTVLKRDQQGLGYGQSKRAKVTHFRARDTEAVSAPERRRRRRRREERREEKLGRGVRREETRRREKRDKDWERDFRASFYS